MAEPLGLFDGGYCGWAVFLCSCPALGGVIWTLSSWERRGAQHYSWDNWERRVRMELAQRFHREILREGWNFAAEDSYASLMGYYGNGPLATT